jgi:hypothetical protein
VPVLREMKRAHEEKYLEHPYEAPESVVAQLRTDMERYWVAVRLANTSGHIVPELAIGSTRMQQAWPSSIKSENALQGSLQSRWICLRRRRAGRATESVVPSPPTSSRGKLPKPRPPRQPLRSEAQSIGVSGIASTARLSTSLCRPRLGVLSPGEFEIGVERLPRRTRRGVLRGPGASAKGTENAHADAGASAMSRSSGQNWRKVRSADFAGLC